MEDFCARKPTKKTILRDSVGEPDPWEKSLRIVFVCVFWFFGGSCVRKPKNQKKPKKTKKNKKTKKTKKTNPEGLFWGAGPLGRVSQDWFFGFFWFFWFSWFFWFLEDFCARKPTKKTILRDSVGEPDPWEESLRIVFFFWFFWFFWFLEDFCVLLEMFLYHFLLYGFSVSSEGCFLGLL